MHVSRSGNKGGGHDKTCAHPTRLFMRKDEPRAGKQARIIQEKLGFVEMNTT